MLKRNIYLDFVKGILIILVVLGHAIQYIGYTDTSFWNDYLFKLIYMFHMPLFLGISGYLTFFSLKKHSLPMFFKSRLLCIGVPILVWCVIATIIYVLYKGNINIVDVFKEYIYKIDVSYWFLKAILIFSILMGLFSKYKLDTLLPLIVSIIFVTLIPFRSHLNIDLMISFYPFFVIGYLLGKHDINRLYLWCKKHSYIFIVISIICYLLWVEETYAYNTSSSIHSLSVMLVRLFGGVSVSVLFLLGSFLCFDKIKNKENWIFLSKIGKNTLGIYLMQGMIFLFFVFLLKSVNIPIIIRLILVLVSPVLCLLLNFLIDFVTKNRILGYLLFGKNMISK